MKRFFTILVVFIVFAVGLQSQQPVKRVLLEQYTGAWCGFCVDGTVIMDNLLKTYPDRIIGVKIHNGDKMVIPEEAVLAGTLGLTGYPGGSVSRLPYQGAIMMSRGSWSAASVAAMQGAPKVDVKLNYSIDIEKRIVKATITCDILEVIQDELRFNVYIIEDNCTGTGSGWDQSNYYNTAAGHPYNGKGNPIVGYKHMKVVRKMLGGPWGAVSSVPMPAQPGEVHKYSFVSEIPADWNIDNLSFVGLAQAYSNSNREILNCVHGIEGEIIEPVVTASAMGQVFEVVDPQKTIVKSVNIRNISSESKTFKADIFVSGRTAKDWNISLAEGMEEVTLNGDESREIKINVTPGISKNYADFKVIVSEKDNSNSLKAGMSFTFLNSNIENVEVINSLGQSPYSILPIIESLQLPQEFVNVMPTDIQSNFTKFKNLKKLIWNCGGNANFNANDVNLMKTGINNKIRTLVLGGQASGSLNTFDSLRTFGVKMLGYNREGYGNAPWRVWLSGIEHDPISGDLGSNFEGNLINYLLPLVEITESSTTPILRFEKAGRYVNLKNNRDTIAIEAEKTVFGVKVQKNDNRYVLLGFTPYVIKDQILRDKLIKNTLTWLDGTVSVEDTEEQKAVISVYPNPMSDIGYFTINADVENISLYIIDIYGSRLMTITESERLSESDILSLNVSELAQGLYYIVGRIGGKSIHLPLTIVK